MDQIPYKFWFLLLIGAWFLFLDIKIAAEHERFVVFLLGKFKGIKGPGLVLKLRFAHEIWVRVSIGDRGELIGPEFARFKEIALPITAIERVALGDWVRITGFQSSSMNSAIMVGRDPEQRRMLRCEKCGHEMKI